MKVTESFQSLLLEVNPELNKQELWTESATGQVMLDNPGAYNSVVRQASRLIEQMGRPDIGPILVGSILSYFLIGYRLGQMSLDKPKTS